MPTVFWFRRDLRLADHPALLAACAAAGDGGVVPLFVLDPVLWDSAGPARQARLTASLRALDESLGGSLTVRRGDPAAVIVALVREVGADSVHISGDHGPYGSRRDEAVARALGDVPLLPLGSPYAVAPGRVLTGAGNGYQVFTPFLRAWVDHGWRAPVDPPAPDQRWLPCAGDGIPDVPDAVTLTQVGEAAAHTRWREFLAGAIETYPQDRDRPGVDGTSRLSAALRWGEIHPRTLLADLDGSEPATQFRAEIAWREFHADVLARNPEARRRPLRPEFAALEHDEPGAAFVAWQRGETGFPIVDAGMRELLATGLMHNRVRMITASFLVKDLHIAWWHGARHFMHHLIDGDLASNQLNWQWVAGSGSDASPYFRVFNPTTQGRKFDKDGTYVRRWIPELADVADPHEPADVPGYPAPIVDHAAERRESLDRWERIRRG